MEKVEIKINGGIVLEFDILNETEKKVFLESMNFTKDQILKFRKYTEIYNLQGKKEFVEGFK